MATFTHATMRSLFCFNGYFIRVRINVNLKMYKIDYLKMYNFTHSIHPSIGKIHP